jgi:acyl phosphate:glycerol-3-phosphate acyltransferase
LRLHHAVLIGVSYLLGSIPTGYWLGKAWKGIDVRQHGSGNLGATNVLRVLGKGPGFITLALDILKGVIPVLLCSYYFPGEQTLALAAGLSAIAGHVTSPFVRFHGGKGVATSAGVFLALLPGPTLIALGVFGLSLVVSRFVSFSSMLAALSLTAAAWALCPVRRLNWATTVLAAFVFWTHRANIRRLLKGTENKIGQKANL